MSKIIVAQRGKKYILFGKVEKVEKNGCSRVVTLSGKRWDKKKEEEVDAEIDVTFRNARDPEGPQFADRIDAAKVREGVVIAVSAVLGDDNTMSGFDFKYNGIITLKADENNGKDINVIVGNVTKVVQKTSKSNEPFAQITVPTGRDDDTKWNLLTAWNNEKNKQLVESVVKHLTPKENEGKKVCKKCIFVCGENTHFGKEDEEGNSFTCFRFDFSPKSTAKPIEKAEETSKNKAAAEEAASENPFTGDSTEEEFIDFDSVEDEALPWA